MNTSCVRRDGVYPPAHLLATVEHLGEQHAELREQGVHRREGGWVIARPSDVTQALVSPALSAAGGQPIGSPPAQHARRLQATMARFSDGALHVRRRALLEQLLPAAAGLQAAAAQRTAAAVQGRAGVLDVMPLARTVPVMVLAAAIAVPEGRVCAVTDLVARVCDALAPRLGPAPTETRDGDEAARELTAALATLGPWDDEQVAAAAGLLFQARDATSALIGSALLAEHPTVGRDPLTSIEEALRRHAPVQCTRRTAVQDLRLGAASIPRGAPVWVVLAAAEQGTPSRPATFGTGPHACPAATHARALARGVLSALDSDGWQPVPAQPVDYEPRPNLRLPSTVRLQRA